MAKGMTEDSKAPVFREKFGRWKAVVWENEREDGTAMYTGKISRSRKVDDGFVEEYTFFPNEIGDYRRALDAIEGYMTDVLSKDGEKR